MKCSNCGNEFSEGIFCPECGTKYEESIPKTERIGLEATINNEAEATVSMSENKKIPWYLSGWFLVPISFVTCGLGWFVALAIAIYRFNKYKKYKVNNIIFILILVVPVVLAMLLSSPSEEEKINNNSKENVKEESDSIMQDSENNNISVEDTGAKEKDNSENLQKIEDGDNDVENKEQPKLKYGLETEETYLDNFGFSKEDLINEDSVYYFYAIAKTCGKKNMNEVESELKNIGYDVTIMDDARKLEEYRLSLGYEYDDSKLVPFIEELTDISKVYDFIDGIYVAYGWLDDAEDDYAEETYETTDDYAYDYDAPATLVTAEQLMRNPNQYVGKKIRIYVKIMRKFYEDNNYFVAWDLSLDYKEKYGMITTTGDELIIKDARIDRNSKILSDDVLEVYGICNGYETFPYTDMAGTTYNEEAIVVELHEFNFIEHQ